MSFRGRLTLFFLLIVVMPMIAVAVLVTQVTAQSRNGKADARLAAGLETALSIHRGDVAAARRAANEIGKDPTLGLALQTGDRAQIQNAARAAAANQGVRFLVVRDPSGRQVASVGASPPVAPYRLGLRGASGAVGSLAVSTTTAPAYLARVRDLTGRDAQLAGPTGPTAATLPHLDASVPPSGDSDDVEVDGLTLRAATTDLPGPGDLRITLFGPTESGGFFSSSPLVVAVLVAFFAVALIFVAMLLRALGGQVAAMLDAARRIGQGGLQPEGAGGRKGRDGRTGERVQQDGRPAQHPDG